MATIPHPLKAAPAEPPVVLPVIPPATPAAISLPPAGVALLKNALQRYLHSHTPQISYPYQIILVEIDPDIISGGVIAAGVAGGYSWRIVPAVPPSSVYPVGYIYIRKLRPCWFKIPQLFC